MSKITLIKGDLFAAPPNTILVHACNTVGSWGAGIALKFKKDYSLAYETYVAHCISHTPDQLIGTTLIIRHTEVSPDRGHDIACLFTSRAYGRKKDSESDIMEATRCALQDLINQNKDGKALHAWYV